MSKLTGPLTITCVAGENLHSVVIFGKMSPYVSLKAGSEDFKTKPDKDGDKNPKWGTSFIFNLDGNYDALHLHVYNSELMSDSSIGRCDIPLNVAALQKYLEKDVFHFDIVDKNNFKKSHGKVLLKFDFKGQGLPKKEDVKVEAKPQEAVIVPAPVVPSPHHGHDHHHSHSHSHSHSNSSPPVVVQPTPVVQMPVQAQAQVIAQQPMMYVQPVAAVRNPQPQVVYQAQPQVMYQAQPQMMMYGQQPQVVATQPQMMMYGQQPQYMYNPQGYQMYQQQQPQQPQQQQQQQFYQQQPQQQQQPRQ